ncbi:IS6 family transposase [Vagococcus sp. DIV0080]|uniref:IS6 family transposase n=1 Tax=Candidatus Vagococcus giribetii TaxID=2230876 RepID=A0ABS3HW19_9ENTE|nr:IS6 family transposase [Vagococcus sp. DIV0080]MBO0477959.1 IS6 family transposase [Vagococcus sp. DIV0080]
MTHFKGKHFQQDIIMVAVGYYLRYNLSYREVSEIMADRGIVICHTTIYRWVQEYSQIVYCLWKKRNRSVGDSWRMDETYIKVKGKWHYLYQAINSSGLTLDIWLRKKRDSRAAYSFFKRLINHFGEPRVLVTDKAPSLSCAFNQLKSEGLFESTIHRTSKYLNNIIEQDHRPIKKRHKLYQSIRTASTTIKGMETVHALYKTNRRDRNFFGFSVCDELKRLMGSPA